MTIKKVHDKQPDKFEFSKENLEIIDGIMKRYPKKIKKVQ